MTDSGLHLLRTFGWGLLLVTERGTADLPPEAPAANAVATATRTSLAVNVRHAADVDGDEDPAVVTINVVVGASPASAPDYRAKLHLTNGVLEIGDVERIDELSVGPGTHVVAIRVSPGDQPDHVTLWIERIG